MPIVAAAGLAVCAALCFFVDTANAGALQIAAIAVSTLTGRAVILLWTVWYTPAKAKCEHMEGVLSAAHRDGYAGVLTLEDGCWHIPKSIWIRKAALTGPDGETESLSVLADKAGALPPDGTAVRVQAVRRYILAWEAQHDEA